MQAVEDIAAKLEAALELIDALSKENKLLREQLELLRQRSFGRSSERLEAGQLDLFRSGETPAVPQPELEAPAPRMKKKGHGRSALPAHLPRNRIVLDVPEAERTCSCCGEALKSIGTEVTERGRIIPARMVVDRYERPKYACPRGHEVKAAELPDGVIEGGKYDATVHAHVVVAKYQDHRVPRRHVQLPQGGRRVSCCTEDEGRPLGIGVQARVPNRLELRGSRARVVSVEGKGVA